MDGRIVLVWLVAAGPLWALAGAMWLPRHYRRLGLDPYRAGVTGGVWGCAAGAAALAYLHSRPPELRRRRQLWVGGAFVAVELVLAFRALFPTNPCVTSGGYVIDQLQSGITIGLVYATMAAGLTLIYSVQRIISFAHGQFVMLGGVASFLLLSNGLRVNSLLAIPVVGLIAFVLGLLAAITLLKPVAAGKLERPGEYALLMTFGLGLFITYALIGVLGVPIGVRAPFYTAVPVFGWSLAASYDLGPVHLRTDLLIAGAIGLLMFGALFWFLHHTWTGRSFRAVAMNPAAAVVAGVDSGRVFVLAFALGSMLAAMAGAALVPAINFPVPEIAAAAAMRSYVVIVLGGLGSVPGALLGGLVIGGAQSMSAACYPDPAKGAIYQDAASLILFAVILLVRPQGFFGEKE